jgi:diaminohydroxyphosphoribosylaminopyrimidine deaminase/5-amino-6-(5-phosphoribosylamino)uracil reductase
VAGQGLASLAAAGIKTECGVLEAQAQRLNQGFMSRMRRGRPWVRIKLATSLDGRTALANGESRWISSQCARADVQRLRAQSSAIMTGSGTVATDDPRLTVRLSAADLGLEKPPLQPTRVVLSAGFRIDPRARVLDPPGKCIIFTTAQQRAETAQRPGLFDRPNVEVLSVRSRDTGFDLEEILKTLGGRGANEVQVEAGAALCGALLRQRLADELVIYMAPTLMGDTARAFAHLPEIQKMTQRVPLRFDDARMVGDDLRITATPAHQHS